MMGKEVKTPNGPTAERKVVTKEMGATTTRYTSGDVARPAHRQAPNSQGTTPNVGHSPKIAMKPIASKSGFDFGGKKGK